MRSEELLTMQLYIYTVFSLFITFLDKYCNWSPRFVRKQCRYDIIREKSQQEARSKGDYVATII
jgi:hypothetical protein